MCGICGFITPTGIGFEQGTARVVAMSERLTHRGPDAAGQWIDPQAGIALGHRRLAVVETGVSGGQPMVSRSGRYVMVFNGEIYNHNELRPQLGAELPSGCGHSDTGVLLAAVERWGLPAALDRCVGTFAAAIWDRHRRCLLLMRDRIGEKPLFYGRSGASLLFGSELKALWAHPHWHGDLDRDALSSYFQLRYVPAPNSIFTGIHKLPPGHWLSISHTDLLAGRALPRPTVYWDAPARRLAMLEQPLDDEQEAVEALDVALTRSVRRQGRADVPVGMLLSGGIDSSLVAAVMQESSARPIQTFTIGFNEAEFDEAVHARAIARHLGTEHHELTVSGADALAVIPELATHWDEPVSDNSQIPTLLLARQARAQVTVALSGDGGDELFCGYRRYSQGARLWNGMARLPPTLRGILAGMLRHTSRDTLNRLLGWMGRAGGARSLADQLKDKAPALEARSLAEFHHRLCSDWQAEEAVVRGVDNSGERPEQMFPGLDTRAAMMLMDLMGWLVDDILVKTDRAGMAASLEIRAPLLDHQLVELAWRMPIDLLYRHGRGKWVLRQLLYRRVPPALVDRPKQGFNMPTGAWLRGPLREWAEDLLDWQRLDSEGLLRTDRIRPLWEQHTAGRCDASDRLWSTLTFLAWQRAYTTR